MTRVAVSAAAVVTLLGLPSAEASFRPLGQDQRISFMGPNGNIAYLVAEPSVAYNPTTDEYLVVWYGEDNTPPLVFGELEIFAQRVSATGAPVGGRIRVSTQGADGDPNSSATYPSVAYNSAANEYLVVWSGEIGATEEFEIWAQRLSATGVEVGGINFQISDMGPDGDANYRASVPSAVYNAAADEYFVVWYGDDNTPPLVDNELEVFGQRLTGTGTQTGVNDFRISEQGADGNPDSTARLPRVAYDAATNEYLVVWSGEIGTTESFEIWAQRLSATGVEVGGNDFQISDLGPPGDGNYDARSPTVAANPSANEYLAVWFGDDDTGPLVDEEFEIYGQRLTGTGVQTGADDFRISDMGGSDGNANYDAYEPQVVYAPLVNEFLVVWWGDDDVPPLQDEQFEVFGQRLTAAGGETGGNDFPVSEPGGDGNFSTEAFRFGVADNGSAGESLVVWQGDIGTSLEFEIFERRLGAAPPVLAATDPAGPANENNPRLKGSVDPDSTIDVFKNATCAGAPAVNDAPAAALNGAGIAVSVPDNSVTAFSATAASDGRTSRCSNSIAYSEVTPDLAPVVSGFAVSPRRFRAGGRSSFRFRLSERATTRIVIERSSAGRRVGRRVGAVTSRNRPAGTNRIAFRGRIGRRGLAPGRYRATITATDAAGKRSVPKRATFRILRRR